MKNRIFNLFTLFALLLSLVGSFASITPARAAGITVNSNADTVANDGVCTLREAITAANTDTASGIATGECPAGSAGADTITFAGNYTITLSGTQLPVVTTQITINGQGTTNTDIRADASPNVATSRVFEVGVTGNLTLSNLTVQNGRCAAMCATYPNDGGGIANSGTLTITFSRLESNSVTQNGGGIFNVGTLTITDSTFSSNTSSNNGGGIYNNDTLTVTNSTFTTNTAGDSGGGIFNGGFAMSITNSTLSGNSASASGGGGIYNSSSNMNTVSITSSTFNNNSSNAGGGIYNVVGNLNITASSFSGNSASATLSGGGGIYNGAGMTITNSTISSNQALADNGGGITNDGTLTITGSTIFNNQAFYNGGGIYNGGGSTLFLENSFISNNSAANTSGGGGGIMNGGGTMNVTNSTFSGNSSTDDGAGIHNNSGTATVTNSTISGNSANFNGGGIYVGTGTFNLRNTIIANSINGGDCAGSFASTSNNLIENASSACGLIDGVDGNIIGSDPNLGALTGSPEYLPLNAGSPAIDAGDNAICAAVPVNNQSQNGVTRPQGANCDIGSYEAHPGVPISIGGVSQGTYTLSPDTSQVLKYAVDGGPVVIGSGGGPDIIASLNQWRRRPSTTVGWTGVSQSMGLPVSLITDTYYFPRYDDSAPSSLYNAMLLANVDTVSRDITVTIGGVVRGTYTLAPSASQFVSYPGVVGGPVVVSSDPGARIVASLYELIRDPSAAGWNGQSEMMGLPASQLSDEYLIPIYFGAANPNTLNASLHIANVSGGDTTVEIWIAGVLRGSYPLAANTGQVVKYALDGGPVVISSNNGANIVASLNQWRRRPSTTVGWTGVSQSMALPVALITNEYVIPRYDDSAPSSLYNALLLANVDSVSRDITVTIGGVVRGTYSLAPSASQFVSYPGVVGGPVVVSSDPGARIVASLYELIRDPSAAGWNGQSEMMGLPLSQLSDQYLIPLYFGAANPNTLNASLYIAVP